MVQFYNHNDVSPMFIVRMRCLLFLFLLCSFSSWGKYTPKQYYIGWRVQQSTKPFELNEESFLRASNGLFNPSTYDQAYLKSTVHRQQILSAGVNFRVLQSRNFKDALSIGCRAAYMTGSAYYFEGIKTQQVESFTASNQTREVRLQETFHAFSGYFGSFQPGAVLKYRHHATWRLGFTGSLILTADIPVQHAFMVQGEVRDVRLTYLEEELVFRDVVRTRVQDVRRFFPDSKTSVLPSSEWGVYFLMSEKLKLFVHAEYVLSLPRVPALNRRTTNHGFQLKISSSI
jgi:hypothetical protein